MTKKNPKRKNALNRSDQQTTEDDQVISDLYLEGHSIMHVVTKFRERSGRSYDLTFADVAMSMDRVRKIWQDKTVKNYDDYVNQELAKLDKLEVDLWAAWEKSKEPQKGVSKKKMPNGDEIIEHWTKTSQGGNAKFAAEIRNCVQQRMALMRPHLSAMEGQTGLTMHEILALGIQAMKALAEPTAEPLVIDQEFEE